MFDKADLLPLPDLTPSREEEQRAADARPSDLGTEAVGISKSTAARNSSNTADDGDTAVSARSASKGPALLDGPHCHVTEACAMADENVAVATSDGRLCHANLSSPIWLPKQEQHEAAEGAAGDPDQRAERNWPHWSSWNSRHGKVLQLTYSPAHDALMTLEHATTAAGDQVFLGRYHRPRALGGMQWESCSIPLATSHACMAVCPRRGWAAVCTGSVVNLWAVSQPGFESCQGHPRHSSPGFEHALSLDLIELVGADAEGAHGGASKDGGAKHIAIFGHTLAVATDHAVFVLRLRFEVKGEAPPRHTPPPSGAESPSKCHPRGEDENATQGPEIHSPSSRLTRHGKSKSSVYTPGFTTSKSNLTEPSKDRPPKPASRSGSQKAKLDDINIRGGKDGHAGRKDKGGGGESTRSSGWGGGASRDGVVEGAVIDTVDVVICVLQGGGEDGNGLGAEGPAPSPQLLQSFDDDWETLRARAEDAWWELETNSFAADASLESLTATGNPAVVERAGRCEVLLARRVGAGEVVKELHLIPVSFGDDDSREANCISGQSSSVVAPCPSSSLSCQLVLLTNKSATVCLVCANPVDIATPSSLSSSSIPLSSPSSSSSSLRSLSSRAEGTDRVGIFGRSAHAYLGRAATQDSGSVRKIGSRIGSRVAAAFDGTRGISGDWLPRVFLRRSCRFNHDLLRASIMRSFLFAFTVEGLEVWTFPSDELPAAERRERPRLDDAGMEGGETVQYPAPWPRPCLLYVQKLEMDGVMPRSPPRSLVAVGGSRPGVLLFPAVGDIHTSPDGDGLAFLAWQSQRRLRANRAVDEHIIDQPDGVLRPPPPAPSQRPFASVFGNDPGGSQMTGAWLAKCGGWRQGFCRLGGGNAATSGSPPLALFLRLRTPTEAFRLLAAAEARAPRPRLAAVSAAFLAAAEGLHGALSAEAGACWREAVRSACSTDGHGGITRGKQDEKQEGPARRAGIEAILPKLVLCWKRQRVAARCASLMARLCLEEAVTAVATAGVSDGASPNVAAAQAFARACSWLLESDESVVECCDRLGEAATRVLETTPAAESPNEVAAQGRWLEVAEASAREPESESGDEPGDDARSSLSMPEACSFGLDEVLTRAMYEAYVLPALGVRGSSGYGGAALGARSLLAPGRVDSNPLDSVLSGLVKYLHGRDSRQVSQPPVLRNADIENRQQVSLATAVVCASRAPWAACPEALSLALRALDEQVEVYAERASVVSSSSTSSRSSLSRTNSGGIRTVRRSPTERRQGKLDGSPAARNISSKNSRRKQGMAELIVDERDGVSGRSESLAHAWIAVARTVLNGFLEMADMCSGKEPKRPRATLGDFPVGADDDVLQLACERHPALLTAGRGGTGPLARALLARGRQRPLVKALVHLTSMPAGGGTGGGSFGPHRVNDLLQLTGESFSATMDPLQALCVLGIPGRQIAARLESLQRASLDAAGGEGSPPVAQRTSFESTGDEASSQFGGVALDRIEKGDVEVSETAARDFLRRRCAVSLAQADRVSREHERLSEALGAPPAWQASLAWSRALDRAILRHLIAAYLDDLRALEGPSIGRAQVARYPPAGADFSGAMGGNGATNSRDQDDNSWADVIVPLLTGKTSRGDGGTADEHLAAIMALVREVTWRGSGGSGSGTGMSPEEASEVVTEAKRRLPAPTPASPIDPKEDTATRTDDTVVWGNGGTGVGMRRAPWPWPSRGVPPSAAGAIVALAAALPPAGKLLAGMDVMLQVTAEVIGAAKAEAAVAAGVAAAAASAVRGAASARRSQSAAGERAHGLAEATATVDEVSETAERALLLYVSEYCGRNPDLWASVTSHVRTVLLAAGNGGEVGGRALGTDIFAAQRLVGALLRRCGEELGGAGLVRALPEGLTLMECLDEVERGLSVEERVGGALGA